MRYLGILFLCLAGVVAVVDGVNYLGTDGELFRSAGHWWFQLHSTSLQLAQPAVERYVLPELWDPVIVTVLRWPLAAILAGIGVVLVLLAIRLRRRGTLLR